MLGSVFAGLEEIGIGDVAVPVADGLEQAIDDKAGSEPVAVGDLIGWMSLSEELVKRTGLAVDVDG